MTQPLAKSAQSVQDVLMAKGLDCLVLELSETTRTANDAANSIGCDVAQIVKSLIFKTKTTHEPVLVLASGPNRVNEKVIESHVGEKIIKADADFTREITGFAIGGIPPVGHKQVISHIYIDQDLMTFEDVWAAAGTPNAVFQLKSKDLMEMTNGKVISIQE
jgi:prolyl-tRNA editing enzyme YbaK/EbsC (Cys-tRNA(Pro) deacylase)